MKHIIWFKMASILVCMGLFTNCATVSFDQAKTVSTVMGGTENTRLGQYALGKVFQREGVSSFYPLRDGMDALGVRIRLAEAAEKSIDLQYFLMKNDSAGAVMANALLKAVDRGVRVRFLLDDVFTTVPDGSFLLINQHRNIEPDIQPCLPARDIRTEFHGSVRRGFLALRRNRWLPTHRRHRA